MTNFWSFSKFKQTFHCSIFLVHLFISLSSVDKPQIIFILFYLLLYLFIYWIIQYLTVYETPDFSFWLPCLDCLKILKNIRESFSEKIYLSKKIKNFYFSGPSKQKTFPSLHSSLVYQSETYFHSISADLTLETYSQYSLLVLLNFCSHTETDKVI